ncbi:MAG: hypothetical protein JW839_05905 [Candidatus Lokiarchaeota archaeon]|nr:hypothetical protein [Candidatus Lokiarchaeota archaeon]
MPATKNKSRIALLIAEPAAMVACLLCLPVQIYKHHQGFNVDFGYLVMEFNTFWGDSIMFYPNSIPGVASIGALVVALVMLAKATLLLKTGIDREALQRQNNFLVLMAIISLAIIVLCLLKYGGGFNAYTVGHPEVVVIPVSSIAILGLAFAFLPTNKRVLPIDEGAGPRHD